VQIFLKKTRTDWHHKSITNEKLIFNQLQSWKSDTWLVTENEQ